MPKIATQQLVYIEDEESFVEDSDRPNKRINKRYQDGFNSCANDRDAFEDVHNVAVSPPIQCNTTSQHETNELLSLKGPPWL